MIFSIPFILYFSVVPKLTEILPNIFETTVRCHMLSFIILNRKVQIGSAKYLLDTTKAPIYIYIYSVI